MAHGNALESSCSFNDLRLYLYHSYDELHDRGVGTSDLMAFAHQIVVLCADVYPDPPPDEWLDIVVGIRPPHDCRAWLISPRTRADATLDELRRSIGMLVPPRTSRTVVFSISGAFGAGESRWRTRGESEFPWPGEWAAVPDVCRDSFDNIIAAAWPAEVPRLSAWLRKTLAQEGLVEVGRP